MRAVIYARYSSQNQREASIEDQVRLCRRHVESRGWSYLHAYTDRATSGASPFRAGYQKLLEDARAGEFDVVVSEALDRLSRDQEDVAGLYKRLSFSGIKIVTLAEGEVSELHVGLKGTMNALYLKDLAQKTRRGLEGRVRKGTSGGGLCYGYEVVHEPGPDATSIALEDPEHVGITISILGHSLLATAVKYDNHAQSIEAGRAYQDSVMALRRGTRNTRQLANRG